MREVSCICRSFEIVVSLYPFREDKGSTDVQPMVTVAEVSRVLGDKGFAVFGAPGEDKVQVSL